MCLFYIIKTFTAYKCPIMMKNTSLILAIAFIMASCSNTGDKSEAASIDTLADSSIPKRTLNAHALCFLRTEGNNNQDTTSID